MNERTPAAAGSYTQGTAYNGYYYRASDDDWSAPGYGYYSCDYGRRWLRNGMCFYIDSLKLEGCIPIITSAHASIAATQALMRTAQAAHVRVNAALPAGQHLYLLANLTDNTNYWGAHLNVLTAAQTWTQTFKHRRPIYSAWLASYNAGMQLITGNGMLLPQAKSRSPFVISQRVEGTHVLIGFSTMAPNRSFLNTRNEPLCATSRGDLELARAHTICFDFPLFPVAGLLRNASQQFAWAMLEASGLGLFRLNVALLLEDPLMAMRVWNRDPRLRTAVPLANGDRLTLVQFHRRVFEEAQRFAETVGSEVETIIPRAGEILRLWEKTLRLFETGEQDALARRIAWVAKQQVLEGAVEDGLPWDDPQLAILDQVFASLDPEDSIFLALQEAGLVDQVVSEAAVCRFLTTPPDDTRAYLRAMLLQHFPEQVTAVDWDHVTLRSKEGYLSRHKTIRLSDPRRHTRAELGHLFDGIPSLAEVLEALEADSEPLWQGWAGKSGGKKGAKREEEEPAPGEAGLLPKLLGSDIEFSNFLVDASGQSARSRAWWHRTSENDRAAWLLLQEIEGVRSNPSGQQRTSRQDAHREATTSNHNAPVATRDYDVNTTADPDDGEARDHDPDEEDYDG